MTRQIDITEPATAESFFAQGYLMANADVRRVYGTTEVAARKHFKEHGHRENRRQISQKFLDSADLQEFRKQKFQRFRESFTSLPADAETLPLFYGSDFNAIENYESESSNYTPAYFSNEIAANPGKLYADIGAGLRNVIFDNCVYVETYPSLTTDIIVEPGAALPFRDASLDGIGCFAVLEHVQEPWTMTKEFSRVLKPGGKIFIDWPFLAPLHGYPSHYYNATREGLRALFLPKFEISSLQTGAHEGPDFTVSWILNGLLNAIRDPKLRKALEKKSVRELAAEPAQGEFWRSVLKTLDDDALSTFSCGNFLIGTRKRD